MNRQQPPPPPMPSLPKPHFCFSGDLSCSGCSPCGACLEKVRTYVLPMAMVRAGFANDPRQAHSFFEAYTNEGWPRLQNAMMRDPSQQGPSGDPGLRGQFMMTDIAGLMMELEMYRAQAQAEAQARAVMQISEEMPGGQGHGQDHTPQSIPESAPTLNGAMPGGQPPFQGGMPPGFPPAPPMTGWGQPFPNAIPPMGMGHFAGPDIPGQGGWNEPNRAGANGPMNPHAVEMHGAPQEHPYAYQPGPPPFEPAPVSPPQPVQPASQPQPQPQQQPVQSAPQPAGPPKITPFDFADAIRPPETPTRVAIGNVMAVPPGMEEHVKLAEEREKAAANGQPKS